MLFAPYKLTIRSAADCFRKPAKLAAALAVAVPLALTANPARLAATDYNGGPVETEDSGRFVRIGLHKSVVIRLPADAHDVIVGNPLVVDAVVRNKHTAYLFARGLGQTNIFFFDADGRQIMAIDLEVTLDMTALQKLIKRTMPGSKITADTVNDNVILGGVAANAAEAKMAVDLADKFSLGTGGAKVVNAIKIAGEDQVMLKVRIVEIQRDVLKTFGINLDAAVNVGSFAFGLATGNPVLGTAISGSAGFSNGDVSIDVFVDAMESDGVLRTLAEPTLTAVSGQPAKFLAGGEFPYVSGTTCDPSGRNCTNTITYKKFGVQLGFTPMVLSEGRISMKIATEVSEISNSSGALSSRAAETTIELPSGGSMMLAGLIKDTTRQQIEGTPGLKNLPVLGALFRSRNYTSDQTELVVMVTPYIVKPVHESELATPVDRYNTATDRQTILFGRLNKVYGTAGKHPDGVYHGSVGYIVE